MTHSAVARRYARGLMQAVLQLDLDQQGPEAVADDLARLAGTIAEFSTLERLVVNPAVDNDDKAAVLSEVADRIGCGDVTGRLLDVLADNERLDRLSAIVAAFRTLVDEHQGIIDATVTTPAPLGDAEVTDLRDKLAGATGRTVRLNARTDPELLGGLVTRIGDVIYDGSLRHHLSRLHDRMIEG